MKRSLSIVISILIFVVGCGVMFYPTISNWVYEQTASYAISDYMDQVGSKSNEEYLAEFAAARAYNSTLSGNVESFLEAQLQSDTDYEDPDYWNTLDEISGIMGVIEIPTINLTLPIYHGSEEEVLQKGVGHLEGSALPTGDVGNHTVLTGHTGLPTATLFTNLDELVLGDYFYLDILDQIFAYEVVNIYVVLPSETDQLVAQADKDLVTLVTCTPYGINSHRLLIQGERVDVELPESLVSTPAAEVLLDTEDTTSALDSLPVLLRVAGGIGGLFVVTAFVLLIRNRPKKIKKTDQIPPYTKDSDV